MAFPYAVLSLSEQDRDAGAIRARGIPGDQKKRVAGAPTCHVAKKVSPAA
jgi:hypothetical protein